MRGAAVFVACVFVGCGAFGSSGDDKAEGPATPDGGGAEVSSTNDSGADASEARDRVFVSKQLGVSSIAVDESSVYWATREVGGHVASCPKIGCPAGGPRMLALSQNDAHHVTVAGEYVAWLADDRLRSIPLLGGQLFETTDGFKDNPPAGFAFLGTTAVVVDGAGVKQCPNAFTTTCPTDTTPVFGIFGGAIADIRRAGSQAIVWNGGMIRRISPPDFNFDQVLNDAPQIAVVAVESEVFYVDTVGVLRSVPLAADGQSREIQNGLPAIVAIAVDARDVYLVAQDEGKVLRVARADGAVTEVATGLVTPRAIALDSDAAWVAVAGSGEIRRISK